MALTEIVEGDTAFLTITFLDKTGAQASPASATYAVYDVASDTELQAATVISPLTAQVEITLSGAVNAIVNQANVKETRQVLVVATYAGGEQKTETYSYAVRNMEYA